MLLNTIIYSTTKYHSPQEISYYILDYGSESLRTFGNFPHIGGMVFAGEDEKYKNLFKYIQSELKERKKLLSKYGGEFKNYNKNNKEKLPLKVFVFNNYDSINENNQTLYETLPDLVRDSERYGIIFIATANNVSSIPTKISQNFKNVYTYKLKEMLDYAAAFGTRKKIEPRETIGRGLVDNGEVHEFQTCYIIENEDELNDYILKVSEEYQTKYPIKADPLPELPEQVTYDLIKNSITTLSSIPIGISRAELSVTTFDFMANSGSIITGNRINNTNQFLLSLLNIMIKLPKQNIIFIDGQNKLQEVKNIVKNYYNENLDIVLDKIVDYLTKLAEIDNQNDQLIIIYGLDKFLTSLNAPTDIQKLTDIIKKTEKFRLILIDDAAKIKQYAFEQWFTKTFSVQDGIWVGNGISEQNLLKIGIIKKEFLANINNNYGYYISEGNTDSIKLINFSIKQEGEKNEE